MQLNCYKRYVNPKAHTYTFTTLFVFSVWYNEETSYKENYTLSVAKDFLIFLENITYRIARHWTCPSICSICMFRLPIVFTRTKDWLPVSNNDPLNQSFHPLHSDNFLFMCEAWDCAPFLSLRSRDFVMAVTSEHMEATAFWASEAAASEQAALVD